MEAPEVDNAKQQVRSQSGQQQPRIFILSTNPCGGSSSHIAKIVRSHAAKEGHHHKRETRRGRFEIRQYRPTAQVNGHEDNKTAALDALEIDVYAPKGEHGKRHQAGSPPFGLQIDNPHPYNVLTRYRRDPFQSCVRAISYMEDELINHYVTCIVDKGHVNCGTRSGRTEPFMRRVNSCWVPWSLVNQSLLAGLLMTACRSLMSVQSQSKLFAFGLLKYKNECIQILRTAVSSTDRCISDQTIALALVLAADEFMTGNLTEYRLHSEGIIKMVNVRGGIKNLGNGFLEHLLLTSVYNPTLKMVDGPVKCH